jgi:hypothetical protein
MRRLYFLIILLITTLIFTLCRKDDGNDNKSDSFIKFYGASYSNYGYDIKQTKDGGYAVVGTTLVPGRGTDVYFFTTDKYGNQNIKPRTYGGKYNDKGYSLQVTSDGGFVILGSFSDTALGKINLQLYLLKINKNGDTLWTRTYGGAGDEEGYCVQSLKDGGYILIGYSDSYSSGDKDVWLIKTDSEGKMVWPNNRLYGSAAGDDVGKFVQETDDGFIFTGSTSIYSSNPSSSDVLYAKTGSDGTLVDMDTYDAGGNDIGECIQVLSDGTYILTGTSYGSNSGTSSALVIKLKSDVHNVQWAKAFGGSMAVTGKSVVENLDHSFCIGGSVKLTAIQENIYFSKIDAQGNQVIVKTIGSTGSQKCEHMERTSDGGYIITGSNENSGNTMVSMIKITQNGDL